MRKETAKVTLIILVTLVSFLILAPIFTSAKGLIPCGLSENDPDTSWDDTVDCDLCGFLWVIKNVIDLLFKLGGTICFIIVVAGGILFLVAGGSENLVAVGKKIFSSAVIGLVIILCSWLAISAILGATGYNATDNWYEFECEMPEPPPPPSPTHLACKDGYCKEVEGEGDDTCHSDDECGHFECRNEKCERIEGKGDDKCSSDIECQPIWSCGSPSQRYATCLTKPECEDACEIIMFATCFNDAEYCKGGPTVYECLQTDDCLKLGLLNYADSFCGGPCPNGSRCCGGTQEEINRAKCQLQCYPAGYNYNPQTGECTCITDTYLKCEKESIQGFPGYYAYYCREVAGTETDECANEGEECVPPEGTPCPSGQDRECPLGQICKNNVCVNGCREDPDCPAGQICENGSCVEKCRDCKPGEKHLCYKRHDRCPGGTCTEFKCCSGCVCECRGWDCVRMKDYCYPSEVRPQCDDGEDNDRDGHIDYPDDPGCTSADDNDEEDPFDDYDIEVDERQMNDASQAVMNLLECMKDKIPGVKLTITSISDDHIYQETCNRDYCSGGNCTKNACPGDTSPQGQCNKGSLTWSPNTCCLTNGRNCVNEGKGNCNQCMCANGLKCQHGCNSCHYGGKNCANEERFSYAVDVRIKYNGTDYGQQLKEAADECGADYTLLHGPPAPHLHASVGGGINGKCGCN